MTDQVDIEALYAEALRRAGQPRCDVWDFDPGESVGLVGSRGQIVTRTEVERRAAKKATRRRAYLRGRPAWVKDRGARR